MPLLYSIILAALEAVSLVMLQVSLLEYSYRSSDGEKMRACQGRLACSQQ